MTAPTPERVDVAILGGGAAGLTLALQLRRARPGTSIVVIEKQRHPVPEATHKVGESTVEIAAHYLRDVLGLGEHLTHEQLRKFGLRMFFSHADNQDITRRVELGHAVLPPHGVGTYQLDRGRLENALGVAVADHGVPLRTGARVSDVSLRPDAEHHRLVVTGDDGASHEIEARWVVDATGRASTLKRRIGLAKKVGHRANAVWFRIGHPIDVDAWSDDAAWHGRIREGRRELSTNHLMGPGYWVWLIRLASGSTSIGIVTDPDLHPFTGMNRLERAMGWLREHEPQCAREIERHPVQDFRVMKDYAYSSEQVFAGDGRWALAGEAGLFLDPLYSPGLDLIAIGNGLITDVVCAALDGEDVEERAAIHNQMFLTIAEGWFRIYEQQYVLMDNARIMLAKVVWDTAVYWAVPGLLYFHDMIRRLAEFPGVVISMARFSGVAEHTQRFFREWHAVDMRVSDTADRAGAAGVDSDTFVGFYDFDFMAGLHIGMTAGLPDAELVARLAENVGMVEQLSGQMVATVLAECSVSTDEQVLDQVRRWRADQALMDLVAAHERADRPMGDGWITLGRARQEAVR
jgi:flavin-dependent dehydrogenase